MTLTPTADSRRDDRGRSGWIAIGVGAVAVFLGWQIVQTALAARLPPELALRFAPGSASVLQRAAEAELAGRRVERARALADASLQLAPFNARALRVAGLARAQAGEAEAANLMLTLAGNWSLRDDPTHAWLVEHRLRQGDYVSAFAHADTLVRRRSDINSRVFELFTTAGRSDPRAVAPLAGLLASRPPWRSAYLEHLRGRTDSDALVLNLALGLENSKGPLTQAELQPTYQKWIGEGRLTAVRYLRNRLAGKDSAQRIGNGAFDAGATAEIAPFGWEFGTSAGLSSEIAEDPLTPGNSALRIAHDGFSTGAPATQMLILDPGPHVLTARSYREAGVGPSSIILTIVCVESGQQIQRTSPTEHADGSAEWAPFEMAFTVPSQGCLAQWLRLQTAGGESASRSTVWFDDFAIKR